MVPNLPGALAGRASANFQYNIVLQILSSENTEKILEKSFPK